MKRSENMSQNFPWVAFFSSLIAAAAMVVSIWSVYYACKANELSSKSNKISETALAISQKTFAEEQRPRLQLKPASKDGVVIYHYIKGNRLFFLIQIEMKNIGKTQAVEITCAQDSAKVVTPEKEFDFGSSKLPQNAKSLSPGQDFICRKAVFIENDNLMRLRILEKNFVQGDLKIFFDLALTYKDVSMEQTYSISAKYRFQENVDYILDYKAD